MDFIWHRQQRVRNLTDHGLDFRDVKHVFEGPTLTYEVDTKAGEPRRFATLGELNHRPVTVIHCAESSRTRVVEFRVASAKAKAARLTR